MRTSRSDYWPRRPMNRRRPPEETRAGREAFRRIVEAVPAQIAAGRYGLQLNAQGFCRCPFHAEDTPSCKIYPGSNGFYCFGCGAGGDVISLAARLLGLTPIEAARRLDGDFAVGAFRPARAQTTPYSGAQAACGRDAARDARQERLDAISGALRLIRRLPRPQPGQHAWAARYALLLAYSERLEEEREQEYDTRYLNAARDALAAGQPAGRAGAGPVYPRGLSDAQRALLGGLRDQEPV